MSGQRPGHETAGFHVFDKLFQDLCRVVTQRLRDTHGLLNHHEPAGQKPQAGKPLGIGLQLLAHTGGHVQALLQKCVNDCR